MLFTKHVTRTQLTNDDFITLHVFKDTQGRRVRHSEDAFHWGVYINSVVRPRGPSGGRRERPDRGGGRLGHGLSAAGSGPQHYLARFLAPAGKTA